MVSPRQGSLKQHTPVSDSRVPSVSAPEQTGSKTRPSKNWFSWPTQPVGVLSVNHLALGLWMRTTGETSKYQPPVGWNEKTRTVLGVCGDDRSVYMRSMRVGLVSLGAHCVGVLEGKLRSIWDSHLPSHTLWPWVSQPRCSINSSWWRQGCYSLLHMVVFSSNEGGSSWDVTNLWNKQKDEVLLISW